MSRTFLDDAMLLCASPYTGAIYTDEVMKKTGLTRKAVTNYLKLKGWTKPCGDTSRCWFPPKL
jgi:hypothetical protein